MSLLGRRHGALLPVAAPSTRLVRWSGDGLAAANLTTSSAAAGDTAPAAVVKGTNSAITISASGVRSPRIRVATNTNETNYARFDLGSLRNQWSTSLTFEHSATPGTTFNAFNGYNSTSRVWRMQINTSNAIALVDGTTNGIIGTTGITISPLTQYRAEIRYDGTNIVFRVYTLDSQTVVGERAGTTVTNALAMDRLWLGSGAQAFAVPVHYYDDIMVTDGYEFIGPPV